MRKNHLTVKGKAMRQGYGVVRFGLVCGLGLYSNTCWAEDGGGAVLAPGLESPLFVPASHAIDTQSYAELLYISGGGHSSYGGDSPSESKLSNSSVSFSGVLPASGSDGLRIGLGHLSSGARASVKLKATNDDPEYTASVKHDMTSTGIMVALPVQQNFGVAVSLVAAQESQNISIESADIPAENISYNVATFSSDYRRGDTQMVLSCSAGANSRDDILESDIEPSLTIGATWMRPGINYMAALTAHEYSKIDTNFEDKASYLIGVERQFGQSKRFVLTYEYEPAYYKNPDGLGAASIGGSTLAGSLTVRLQEQIDAGFASTYSPRSTGSVTKDGVNYKASVDATSLGFILRKMF